MKKIDKFTGEFGFLCNFYPAKFVYQDLKYPTSEHAFQASKATNSKDRRKVRLAKTPAEAKRIGRKIKLRENWDSIRINVMRDILLEKFNQNPDLKEKLINTGDLYLEEGNDWGDKFWGTVNGKGKNNLGKVLMSLRKEFRKEEK